MNRLHAYILLYTILGCSMSTNNTNDQVNKDLYTKMKNPFFNESALYMHYPPFDKIKNAHYKPAFDKGMEEHIREIESIANNLDDPTFDNTIIAMEQSGELLDRVATVFFALTSANTNDEMEKIQSEMAPKFSAHSDKILLNKKLFDRISFLNNNRNSLELKAEGMRLIEKYYNDFVQSGAKLLTKEKEHLKSINGEIAVLQTNFSQNVLKEVNALAVIVDSKQKLDGLSDAAIEAAANEAKSRKLEGKYVIALKNTSSQPLMALLSNRSLRKKIHKASLSRGSRGGEFDNREILSKVIKLRAEKAQLMGYKNHAAYRLESQTAQTPDAVNQRLSSLAPKALSNAKKEATDLQKMIDMENGGFQLASWDWDYYTEKVRSKRYNFDATQLKP